MSSFLKTCVVIVLKMTLDFPEQKVKKGINWKNLAIGFFVFIVLFVFAEGINFDREQYRKLGYNQASIDYFQARALPIVTTTLNNETNQININIDSLSLCTQEFYNNLELNYLTICQNG